MERRSSWLKFYDESDIKSYTLQHFSISWLVIRMVIDTRNNASHKDKTYNKITKDVSHILKILFV